MVASSTNNLEGSLIRFYQEHFGETLHTEVEKKYSDISSIHTHLDSIISSIKNQVWSKSHFTVLNQLNFHSSKSLNTTLKKVYVGEETKQEFLNAIEKCNQISRMISNSSLTEENKQLIQNEILNSSKNLISAYNFCTLNVPEQIVNSGAWHGEQIRSGYLEKVKNGSDQSFDSYIAESVDSTLQRGQYLIRPCSSRINRVKSNQDLYVIEWRSISTGKLQKDLFTFEREDGKFKRGQGKGTFDSFEELRLSLLRAEYRPVNK